MNKALSITKSTLGIIIAILIIIFIKEYTYININFLLFSALFSILIITNIKDYIMKNKIQLNNIYNILSIITLSIIIIIFLRTLYDPNLIYNSSNYVNQVKERFINSNYLDELKWYNTLYLYQNLLYFLVLLTSLLIYRKINMEKQKSKYNIVTLTCLIISICTIMPSISLTSDNHSIFKYIIFNTLLIGTEIYRLIKDNHKKYEWPIYISFIFNTFAIVMIICNLILA